MDAIQKKKREIFFNNLILLGFDKDAMERKYAVQFHRDMFMKPNKKAFQVVTYFLFSKLNEVTGSNYHFIWPLLCTEHERQFPKTCSTYFSAIAQESAVRFPNVQTSILSTYSGERFRDLYFAFSCHVMEKCIQSNANVDVISRPILHENFEDVEELLRLATRISENEWKKVKEISQKALLLWHKCAKDLCICLKRLEASEASYKNLLQEKINLVSKLDGGEQSSEVNSLPNDFFTKMINFESKVKTQWETLAKFLDKEEEAWQYISSEIDANEEKFFIDASNCKIHVPFPLTESCLDLGKVDCPISDSNGKLSLKKFLKTFIIVLESLVKNLKLDLIQFPETLTENPSISEELRSIKLLNEQLNDIISAMKENVEQWRENIFLSEIPEEMENLCEEFPLVSSALNLEAEGYGNWSIFPKIDDSTSKIFTSNGLCLQPLDINTFKEKSIIHQSSEYLNSVTCTQKNITEEKKSESLHKSNQHCEERKSETATNLKSLLVQSKAHSSTLKACDYELVKGIDDFSQSKKFKMRESWSNVESLDSMTLPELPFDENNK